MVAVSHHTIFFIAHNKFSFNYLKVSDFHVTKRNNISMIL